MDDVIQEELPGAAEKQTNDAEDARKRELVALARQRFTASEESESEVRRLADEDTRFRAGQQWNEKVLKQRELDGRPALVINRIPQFEKHITNENRQSRPAITVSPVDSGADPETAKMYQGLIRHIEYDSSADVAYDTAFTGAVRGGIGYYRLVTEFESEGSFDQALKIKRVRDYSSVYLDPGAQEPDGSDANFAFVVDDGMSAEEFKTQYPDCEPSVGGWGNRVNTNSSLCQVVEYFYREHEKDELLLLQPTMPHPETGELLPSGQAFAMFASDAEESPGRVAECLVLNKRPTQRIRVKWAKIAGSTVIEETEFPSKWIPVFPVLGDEVWTDGKRILEGVVRHAKDPQRMYNYWSTSVTETIALAPKAPYIGAEGQFEGKEKAWAKAATRNVPYLEYKPKTVGGVLAPPPQRQAFEAPIQGMTMAMQFAADDMKATTGIYDSALGNRSNESSGRAILARQNQSQVSTFHFSDNLARSLRHLGRVLIDAIPRVYSGARVVRILGEDNSQQMVGVNGAQMQQGQKQAFALGTGKYDVAVSMGPSFTSKRQEAGAAMLELASRNPQIGQSILDLVVSNMDWPGADKMAERLRKMLPPGIAEPQEKDKQDPAMLAQQLQQAMQQHEQLVAELNRTQDVLESKTLELQSKERTDLIAQHVDLAKEFAKTAPEDGDGRAILLMEMQSIQRRLGDFAPAPEMPNPQPQQPQLQPGGM